MKRLAFAMLIFLTFGLAWAEEEPMSLSVNDALRIAFEKNPDLKAAEARLEIARGIEKQERSQGGLQLSANALAMDSSTSTMIPTGTDPTAMFMVPTGFRGGGSAVAALPIFTGGKISQSILSAAAGRESEAFRFKAARIQLVYAVKLAYFQALVAQGEIDVARDELTENLETLYRTQTLLNAGKIPEVDLLREKTEASESKRKLIEAENHLEIKKINLLRLLALNLQTPIRLSDSLQETSSNLPNLQTLLTEAEHQRPELLAEQKEVASKEALLRAAHGEYSPQVYAYGRADTFSGSPGQFNGTSVGLVASFPLFDSGRRSGKIEEAEGKLRELLEQEDALRLDVGQEVIQARLNLEAATKLLQEARDAVLSAKEDLRIARLRFENGKAIQLELLDAVAADTRAKLRKLEALSAYQIALADLDRSLGRTP